MDETNQSSGSENQTETNAPEAVPMSQSAAPVTKSEKKLGKKKLLLPLAALAGLFIIAGAAAYVTVFNKSPEQLFSSALENTGNAIEEYLSVEKSSDQGTSVDGSISVTSPVAVDAELSGQFAQSNGKLEASLGAAGARLTTELRTIGVENSAAPDVYVRVDGLNSIAGLVGLLGGFGSLDSNVSGVIDELDGKWLSIDHTYFQQQALRNADTDELMLSQEEINQIRDAVFVVLRERLFTTDEATAVFDIREEVGKEDFEGTGTYKVKVGVNKENLIAFLEAFEPVVNDTPLKKVVESLSGNSVEEALPFDDIRASLEGVDVDSAHADVWIEDRGRFIRNIRFYPQPDQKETNYLDFMLPYDGGDTFPLVTRATIDSDVTAGTLEFGIALKRDASESKLSFDVTLDSAGNKILASGELTIAEYNGEVDVTAPAGAQNVLELVQQLGSGLLPSEANELLQQLPTDSPVLDDIELQTDFLES